MNPQGTAGPPDSSVRGRSPSVLVIGCLFALLWCGPVRAEFVPSARVMDWLDEAAKRGGSFKDTTLAIGFVSGVHDLLPEGEVCLPERQSLRAMLPAIRDWMKAHRDRWVEPSARTVRQALIETFPCPPGGAR